MTNVPSYIWVGVVLYWALFFLPTYLCLKVTKSGDRIGRYGTWISINIALVLAYFLLPPLGVPDIIVDGFSQIGWLLLTVFVLIQRYELNSAHDERSKFPTKPHDISN